MVDRRKLSASTQIKMVQVREAVNGLYWVGHDIAVELSDSPLDRETSRFTSRLETRAAELADAIAGSDRSLTPDGEAILGEWPRRIAELVCIVDHLVARGAGRAWDRHATWGKQQVTYAAERGEGLFALAH